MNTSIGATTATAFCGGARPGFDPANPSNASTRMQGGLVDAAVDDGNTLFKNTFGKGFVAFDHLGRLQQARQGDAFRLLGVTAGSIRLLERTSPAARGARRAPGRSRAIVLGSDAGWSSLVARWAHNPKVASSNLAPATKKTAARSTS